MEGELLVDLITAEPPRAGTILPMVVHHSFPFFILAPLEHLLSRSLERVGPLVDTAHVHIQLLLGQPLDVGGHFLGPGFVCKLLGHLLSVGQQII